MTLGWLAVWGGAGPGGGAPSVDSRVAEEGARDEACPGPGGGASELGVGGGRVPLPVMVTVVPTLIWSRQKDGAEVTKAQEPHPEPPLYISEVSPILYHYVSKASIPLCCCPVSILPLPGSPSPTHLDGDGCLLQDHGGGVVRHWPDNMQMSRGCTGQIAAQV